MRHQHYRHRGPWEHFGGPGGFEAGFRHRRGGGRQRGDLKYEILEALLEGPRHGYDIMLEIERKRGLRPSPGSIYPALQMLEDGDFVRGEERDGKRIFTITEKGRELLASRAPQPEGDEDDAGLAVMAEAIRAIRGIKDAARHIARGGEVEQFRKAVKVLERTRRELYAILSEEPAEE